MAGKNKTYISTEQFIRSYMASSTAEEVARNLGVDVKYVVRRSNQMRKNGVKMMELPSNYVPLRSGRKPLNAQEIFRLVKECQSATPIKTNNVDALSSSINQAIENAIS